MKTLIVHFKNDTGRVVDTSIRTLPEAVATRLADLYRQSGHVIIIRDARPGELDRDERRFQRALRNTGGSLAA